MNKLAYEAAADWQNCEDNSGSTDSGIEALGQLCMALSREDAAFRTIIGTAAKLIGLYAEYGSDPDGETSMALSEELHRANLL